MSTVHSISNRLRDTTLPALELRILLMHVLQKSRVQLITQSDYVLSAAEQLSFGQLVQRRLNGEPIAYLTGQREFYGLNFLVSPDVLIPRPDTELLVELALQYSPAGTNLLDLGTGSGAIAVTLAHLRSDLQIWASDISEAALKVAQHNAGAHQCTIQFRLSDWFAGLPEMQWQTIVSNPPYIENQDPHLRQGDLRYEPVNALTDHADGLSAYRTIIAQAQLRLADGGWLLLEHGYDQAGAVRNLLSAQHFTGVQSWRDLAGIERVSGGTLAAGT